MPVLTGFGSFTQDAAKQCLINQFLLHANSTSTTIQNTPGRRVITYTGGALAITLRAPNAGTDDGMMIQVINVTSQQHTVTCTGKLNDGAGHLNTATFPANPGAAFTIVAYNGAWYLVSNNLVVFS